MKNAETVTDNMGNVYIIPGHMSREEAEVYFPNQPERSKREDSQCDNCFRLEEACGNSFSQHGHCPRCRRFVRCGALNIVETQ